MYIVLRRVISAILVIACLVSFSGISLAGESFSSKNDCLAPTSRFKPIVNIIKKSDGTYAIRENKSEIASLNEGLSGQFKLDVGFLYITQVISDAFRLNLEGERSLKSMIKAHLARQNQSVKPQYIGNFIDPANVKPDGLFDLDNLDLGLRNGSYYLGYRNRITGEKIGLRYFVLESGEAFPPNTNPVQKLDDGRFVMMEVLDANGEVRSQEPAVFPERRSEVPKPAGTDMAGQSEDKKKKPSIYEDGMKKLFDARAKFSVPKTTRTTRRTTSVIDAVGCKQVLVSVSPRVIGTLEAQMLNICDQMDKALAEHRIGPDAVIKAVIFLKDPADRKTCEEILGRYFNNSPPPIAYINQPPADGDLVAAELAAVDNASKLYRLNKYVSVIEQDGIFWANISGIEPDEKIAGTYEQAYDCFEKMKKVIDGIVVPGHPEVKFNFENIIRTWLYERHIVDMEGETERYAKLNLARKDFFAKGNNGRPFHFGRGLIQKDLQGNLIPEDIMLPPASTGIGMSGTNFVFEALALSTSRTDISITPLQNPEQVNAFDYRGDVLKAASQTGLKTPPLFSRGMAVSNGIVIVSGTASIIGPKTVCVGDSIGQTNTTIDNIYRVINQTGATLEDVLQIRVYIKNGEDYGRIREIVEKRLPNIPCLYLIADVCRPDLLVEIEAVVAAKKEAKVSSNATKPISTDMTGKGTGHSVGDETVHDRFYDYEPVLTRLGNNNIVCDENNPIILRIDNNNVFTEERNNYIIVRVYKEGRRFYAVVTDENGRELDERRYFEFKIIFGRDRTNSRLYVKTDFAETPVVTPIEAGPAIAPENSTLIFDEDTGTINVYRDGSMIDRKVVSARKVTEYIKSGEARSVNHDEAVVADLNNAPQSLVYDIYDIPAVGYAISGRDGNLLPKIGFAGYGMAYRSQGQAVTAVQRLVNSARQKYDTIRTTVSDGMQRGELNVLFACTSNVIRSTTMHLITEDFVEANGLAGVVKIASIGTEKWDVRDIRRLFSTNTAVLQDLVKHGISEEIARRFRPNPEGMSREAIDKADMILVAEEYHRQAIIRQFPEAVPKVFLLKEVLPFTHPDYGEGIPDGIGHFDEMAEALRGNLLPLLVKPKPSATDMAEKVKVEGKTEEYAVRVKRTDKMLTITFPDGIVIEDDNRESMAAKLDLKLKERGLRAWPSPGTGHIGLSTIMPGEEMSLIYRVFNFDDHDYHIEFIINSALRRAAEIAVTERHSATKTPAIKPTGTDIASFSHDEDATLGISQWSSGKRQKLPISRPDLEQAARVTVTELVDTVKICAYNEKSKEVKEERRSILIAVEIPDNAKQNPQFIAGALRQVTDSLKRRGMLGSGKAVDLKVVWAKTDNLYDKIISENAEFGAPLSNIVVLGRETTLTSARFDPLRGRSFLACTDFTKLPDLVKLLNIAMKLAFGLDTADNLKAKYGDIEIDLSKITQGIVILMPKIVPIDTTEQDTTYRLQIRELRKHA